MIRSDPLVSIVVPCYNHGHYLGQAIASVLAQTYSNYEIIVVDDGSQDDTRSVVERFGSPKIRYLFQENRGRSNARNAGLAVASGDYIAFLDSDDFYLPEKLALQIDFLQQHPEFGMIYTSAYCIAEDGRPIAASYEATDSGWIYEKIAFFRPLTITLPTVMLKREVVEAVGGFDERMDRFEDTDYWRRVSKSWKIGALPLYTCKLRSHGSNMLRSQNPSAIVSAIQYYAQKIMREDQEVPLNVRRHGLGRLCLHYAEACLSIPAFRPQGKALFADARHWWPTNPRLAYAYLRYVVLEPLRARADRGTAGGLPR